MTEKEKKYYYLDKEFESIDWERGCSLEIELPKEEPRDSKDEFECVLMFCEECEMEYSGIRKHDCDDVLFEEELNDKDLDIYCEGDDDDDKDYPEHEKNQESYNKEAEIEIED